MMLVCNYNQVTIESDISNGEQVLSLGKLSGYYSHSFGVPGKRPAVIVPGFLLFVLWRWSGWSMQSMGLWHGCVIEHISILTSLLLECPMTYYVPPQFLAKPTMMGLQVNHVILGSMKLGMGWYSAGHPFCVAVAHPPLCLGRASGSVYVRGVPTFLRSTGVWSHGLVMSVLFAFPTSFFFGFYCHGSSGFPLLCNVNVSCNLPGPVRGCHWFFWPI